MSAPKPLHVPRAEDMDRMTDIHDRLIRRAALLVPMNRNDEGVLGDAAIPFQDEAYACGLARGQQECNAELLEALQALVSAASSGATRFDEDDWLEARAAIAKATGSAQ